MICHSRFACRHALIVSSCHHATTVFNAMYLFKPERTKDRMPAFNSEPRPCPKSHPHRTHRTCYPYFVPRSQPNSFIFGCVKLRNRETRVDPMSTRSLQLLTVSISAWLLLVDNTLHALCTPQRVSLAGKWHGAMQGGA